MRDVGPPNNLGSFLTHRIGSLAVQHSDNMHYVMQVVSDAMPSQAPLHGAVWEALIEYGSTDVEEIFNYIEKEICYVAKNESIYDDCQSFF